MGGILPRGVERLQVVLKGGRRLDARVRRMPRSVSRGRAAVVVLPRDARLRALRLGGEREPMTLPAPARQCGYSTFVLTGF